MQAFVTSILNVYNPEVFSKYPNLLKSSLTHKQTLAANKALEGFDYRN